MNVLLFFTFKVSIKDWKNSGILEREIKYYENIKKKHNCSYTFFTYGDLEDKQILNSLNTDINIITLFKKKKLNNSFLVFFYSLYYVIKNHKKLKKFEFLKSNQNYGSWILILLKWINKSKIISRCGYDLFHFSVLKKNPIKIIISYFICLFIYKNSNIILSPSDFYKNFISKFYFIDKKMIKVLPNFVDTNIFFPNDSISKYKKRILFIGRLEKQKNIFSILKSISNSDYQLDILGTGSLKLKIIKFAIKNNCNIHFIAEKYSNNEIPQLLNKYKFFILFSLYEGNPKVLLEAMSCGLCAITSNTYGINNIINNFNNGIMLNLNDYSSILSKISMLDEHLINNLSNNSSNFIKKNHSLEMISNLEFKYYSNV